jgi:L-ascorbate metabolism protein UlaG (beta-lactamase superfamily)
LTLKGPLLVQPVSHASLVLTWTTKPSTSTLPAGPKPYAGLNPPDLVLITDIHGDHCDTKTLAGLNTAKAIFVVPQAVADKLAKRPRRGW